MNWQQDGPGQKGADQTDYGEHPEESQEEERVDGAIVENVIIVDGQERPDPVEQAIRERGSWAPASGRLAEITTHSVGQFLVSHVLGPSQRRKGPRCVDARAFGAEDEEQAEADCRVYEDWHEGGR